MGRTSRRRQGKAPAWRVCMGLRLQPTISWGLASTCSRRLGGPIDDLHRDRRQGDKVPVAGPRHRRRRSTQRPQPLNPHRTSLAPRSAAYRHRILSRCSPICATLVGLCGRSASRAGLVVPEGGLGRQSMPVSRRFPHGANQKAPGNRCRLAFEHHLRVRPVAASPTSSRPRWLSVRIGHRGVVYRSH